MKTVKLLVGTSKGLFVLRATAARRSWQLEGPHLAGRAIYSVAHDGAGSGSASGRARRACTGAPCWSPPTTGGAPGTSRRRRTSSFRRHRPRAEADLADRAGARGRAGHALLRVDPAALFRTTTAADVGGRARAARPSASRALDARRRRPVPAHDRSRSRKRRPDVGGDLVAGVYRTTDGAARGPRQQGHSREFLPRSIRVWKCVHKVVQHPDRNRPPVRPEPLGPLRSDDAGTRAGHRARVPSDFGFAIDDPSARAGDGVHHPRSSRTRSAFSPREASRLPDTERRALVEALTRGLPQRHAYDICCGRLDDGQPGSGRGLFREPATASSTRRATMAARASRHRRTALDHLRARGGRRRAEARAAQGDRRTARE